ncbi:MAG TPA: ATP-binding SpoIIE family protein phosphatase [Pararobbsia sp.]|nr:ATP-binding SpoIIE family protein phosphatase [Pararobbsia sp.]
MNNVPSDHAAFAIADASSVAFARRGALDAARRIGLNDTDAGRVALIVTEAATNILKHAGHGEILVRELCTRTSLAAAATPDGVEIIALDQGPGIRDLHAALTDGMSSTGTPGNGLGAMHRLSNDFAIYSQPGTGTAMRAYVRHSMAAAPAFGPEAIDSGGIGVPYPGETVCGDAWTVLGDERGLTTLVIDGLGHGPDAHRAAKAGIEVVHTHRGRSPGELIERMHDALRPTRGAAAAVARIDFASGRVTFAGVGNISASVHGAQDGTVPADATIARSRQLVSHNGIVGHTVRKIQEFEAAWSRNAMLVMHSDGVATRWQIEHYPGLANRSASLIAAMLYRDFARGRDDATVVVTKAPRD